MYKSISCYLIKKRYCAIRNFYRYSKLYILLYFEILAYRERYSITVFFFFKILIFSNIKNYINFIKTKISVKY